MVPPHSLLACSQNTIVTPLLATMWIISTWETAALHRNFQRQETFKVLSSEMLSCQFSSFTKKACKGECTARNLIFFIANICWERFCRNLWLNAEGKSVGGNSMLRCCRVLCMAPPTTQPSQNLPRIQFAQCSKLTLFDVEDNTIYILGKIELHNPPDHCPQLCPSVMSLQFLSYLSPKSAVKYIFTNHKL